MQQGINHNNNRTTMNILCCNEINWNVIFSELRQIFISPSWSWVTEASSENNMGLRKGCCVFPERWGRGRGWLPYSKCSISIAKQNYMCSNIKKTPVNEAFHYSSLGEWFLLVWTAEIVQHVRVGFLFILFFIYFFLQRDPQFPTPISDSSLSPAPEGSDFSGFSNHLPRSAQKHT